jgi:hypothetical protein
MKRSANFLLEYLVAAPLLVLLALGVLLFLALVFTMGLRLAFGLDPASLFSEPVVLGVGRVWLGLTCAWFVLLCGCLIVGLAFEVLQESTK